jgi:hypothetical protein
LEQNPDAWQFFSWVVVRVQLNSGGVQMAVGSSLAAILNDPVKWREYPFDLAPQPDVSTNFTKYKDENREAAEILLQYVPNDPNNTEMHYDIAETLYRAEDWQLANEHARRALDLDRVARAILAEDEHAPILARKLIGRQHLYLEQRLLFAPEH